MRISRLSAVSDQDVLAAFTAQHAVHHARVLQLDSDRLVAAREARARKHDRFEQISLGADFANSRQVRTDAAANVADGVAGQAGNLGVVEHLLAAAHVARLHRREQLIEALTLPGRVGVQRGEQWLRFAAHGL